MITSILDIKRNYMYDLVQMPRLYHELYDNYLSLHLSYTECLEPALTRGPHYFWWTLYVHVQTRTSTITL